jgi:predicted RNase H-like HicB family nuclease
VVSRQCALAPCCNTGDTAEEAIQNLQETVHTALEVYEEEGMTLPPLPADYKPEDLEDPDFVSLLTLSVGVPKR